MIMLTRLNGQAFVVNAELIKYVESVPDTTLTLLDGQKVLVKETMQEVVEKALLYGQSLRKLTPPS